MKKIVYLLLTTAAICFCSCGGKNVGDSEAASNKETLKPMLNIETPADPTGDIANDTKDFADYLSVVIPLIDEVAKKVEVYEELYRDNAVYNQEKEAICDKLENDTNLDYRDLEVPADPIGDAKKDAETLVIANTKLHGLRDEFVTTYMKYIEYYSAKSEEEKDEFADALNKQLPENVKKILNGE